MVFVIRDRIKRNGSLLSASTVISSLLAFAFKYRAAFQLLRKGERGALSRYLIFCMHVSIL